MIFQILIWGILFPIQFIFVHIILRGLSIPAVFFAKRVEYTTKVKYYNKEVKTLMRFKLPKWLSWLDTPDNATDEYFYNLMYKDSYFKYIRELTLEKFESSRLAQILCMILWLQRNCGYGFSESILGKLDSEIISIREKGIEDSGDWSKLTIRKSSFQYESQFDAIWISIIYASIIFILGLFNTYSIITSTILVCLIPIFYFGFSGRYVSVNIGYKPHKNTNILMYAGRPIGLRKYQ